MSCGKPYYQATVAFCYGIVKSAKLLYIDLLRKFQIQISMAAVGEAEEKGYAERLMHTIKEEEVDLPITVT